MIAPNNPQPRTTDDKLLQTKNYRISNIHRSAFVLRNWIRLSSKTLRTLPKRDQVYSNRLPFEQTSVQQRDEKEKTI